jgi:hypothetical protein
MEYFRDKRNQIQADIAYRLGKISIQYRAARLATEEDYSVTLDVCILQNLLTSCVELLKAMSRHERKAVLNADTLPWGLRPDMIENTFHGKLTGEVVLKRMRNALSHPTALNLADRFPSTGYTTVPNGSGIIHKFVFVNSPDVRRSGRPKMYQTREKAQRALEEANEDGDMPKEVKVILYSGSFCFGNDNEPFARIFKIHLTAGEIHTLVVGLSNHLAQPTREDWDGATIERLVA